MFVLVAVVASLPYGLGEAIATGVIVTGVVLVFVAAKRHFARDEPAYESSALVRFWLWVVAVAALLFFVAAWLGMGVWQAVLAIAPIALLVAVFLLLRRSRLKGTGRDA